MTDTFFFYSNASIRLVRTEYVGLYYGHYVGVGRARETTVPPFTILA